MRPRQAPPLESTADPMVVNPVRENAKQVLCCPVTTREHSRMVVFSVAGRKLNSAITSVAGKEEGGKRGERIMEASEH